MNIYLDQCSLLQIRDKAFVFVCIFYFVSLCVLLFNDLVNNISVTSGRSHQSVLWEVNVPCYIV